MIRRDPIGRAYLLIGRDYLKKLPSEFDSSDWERARWWLALQIYENEETERRLKRGGG